MLRAIAKIYNNELLGTGVLGKLVGTARHLYSNGNSNVFVKKGRYTDAVSDFYSLKPTRVRTKQMKGKVRIPWPRVFFCFFFFFGFAQVFCFLSLFLSLWIYI